MEWFSAVSGPSSSFGGSTSSFGTGAPSPSFGGSTSSFGTGAPSPSFGGSTSSFGIGSFGGFAPPSASSPFGGVSSPSPFDSTSSRTMPRSIPAFVGTTEVSLTPSDHSCDITWFDRTSGRIEETYPYERVTRDSTRRGVYHFDGKEVIVREGTDTSLLDSCIFRTRETERKKRMCRRFLIEKCNVTDEIIEKFDVFGTFGEYLPTDKGMTIGGVYFEPPVGWFHLGLQYPDTLKALDENWHYVYHGTRCEFVGSIIKNRLVRPGNKTADGTLVKILPGHIQGKTEIYTSPSIHYSANPVYAKDVEWYYTDEEGKTKRYYVRVVFQCRQQPGTFEKQGNTLGEGCWDGTVDFDDVFPNNEIEWWTTDATTIIPKALLIHFSEVRAWDLVRERLEMQRKKRDERLTATRSVFESVPVKKGILWVDDNPDNNASLIKMVQDRGINLVRKRDTDSALEELRVNPKSYSVVISDLARIEKRRGDSEPRDYKTAGLDFLKEARQFNTVIKIYIYSAFCRNNAEMRRQTEEAGVSGIPTYNEMVKLIEEFEP